MSVHVYCEVNSDHNDIYDWCPICAVEELQSQVAGLKGEVQRLSEALAACFYYSDGAKQFDGSAWIYHHWRLKKIAEVARECMEENAT